MRTCKSCNLPDGEVKFLPRAVSCSKCYLVARKTKHDALKARGLCHCGQPLQVGRKQCTAHLLRSKDFATKAQRKNRELGLCPCGKNRASNRKFCQQCLDTAMRRILPQRRSYKRRAVDMLGGKCADCNFSSEYLQVFDFHHIDPTVKDGSVSRLLASQKPWEVVEAEVLKCALLCANCHRIRHAKEHTS